MPIYRVETQQQGQLKLRRWRHSLRRALGLLAFTILACMAGLILLDPEQHSWQLKAFDALWNAINAVTTVGDFTAFNRGQRAFMLATVFAFVGVGGYAVTTLTGVLASQELKNFRENRTMSRLLEELEGHVVIVGFGAVGRLVAGALKARGQPVVVVDMSPDVAAEASALGYLTVQGDASVDEEALERARIKHARAMYVTTEDPDRKLTITLTAHTANPALAICVTGQNDARGALLRRAGASEVVVIDTLIAESVVARLETGPKAKG